MKKDVERALRRLARLPVQERRGRPAGPRPTKADLLRLYVTAGLSIRATARALNISKDAVARALAAYHIKRRPQTRAHTSRLAVYPLADLRRRVKDYGLRATARVLGVSAPGLLAYLRRYAGEK